MQLFALILAVLIGMSLPMEAGVNTTLRRYVSHPVHATLISYIVGTVALLLLTLGIRKGWPTHGRLAEAPWWSFTGGLLGAGLVTMFIVAAPRLGAVALVAAVIAGQMFASVVADHFALVGYPRHVVSPGRVCGLVLIAAGVLLVQKL